MPDLKLQQIGFDTSKITGDMNGIHLKFNNGVESEKFVSSSNDESSMKYVNIDSTRKVSKIAVQVQDDRIDMFKLCYESGKDLIAWQRPGVFEEKRH